MTSAKSKGGSCTCCPDCSQPHLVDGSGCAGCLPSWMCVLFEFESEDCCQFHSGNIALPCDSSTYTGYNAICGDIVIAVSVWVEKVAGECCFFAELSTTLETVTYSKCGDLFEASFVDEAFSISFGNPYDPQLVAGTFSITNLGGVSNTGQFGDLSEGRGPHCPVIRMNPRKIPEPDPQVQPCTRPDLATASKTADRAFGTDWLQQISDGNLFSNEFCWFVPPCKCIPSKVCVTYTYYHECEGLIIAKASAGLSGCGYGPVTFEIDRGGYVGIETVTIAGTLPQEDCEIIWTISGSSMDTYELVNGLTRLDEPEDFNKRCNVVIPSPGITIDGSGGVSGIDDTIVIDEDCLCLTPAYELCPGACFDIRMPPNANPDCFLVELTCTVTSGCEFGGVSFPMHAENYGPANKIQDQLAPHASSCQSYVGYVDDYPGYTIPFPECTTVEYVDTYPTQDSNNTYLKCTLYYPSDCAFEGEVPPTPKDYRLKYEVTNSCGLPSTIESGIAVPTYSSCKPFELVFVISHTPLCECGDCTDLTLRITL